MSASLASAASQGEAPKSGACLLLALAAISVFPFDRVLAGMVGAGHGIEAICLYLGLSRSALGDSLVRLGLRAPHDRPLRKPGRRGWSVLDTMRLIVWRLAGVHPETIAERLSSPELTRSVGAVRAKARRLGLAAPPRKTLRRLDPASLVDPPPGFALSSIPLEVTRPAPRSPASVCGTAAGPIELPRPAPPAVTPPPPVEAVEAAAPLSSSQSPSSEIVPSRGRTGGRRVAGQRELALLPVVGGSDAARPVAPIVAEAPSPAVLVTPAVPAMPRTEAEIDLNGDLTWVAAVRQPLTNRLVVWVLGMLVMGGLHYTVAAARVGKTPASFRTLRTRCGVPVDYGRRKFGALFDLEVAQASCAQAGYVVKRYVGEEGSTPLWFWAKTSDKSRTPPTLRRRDHLIEGRSDQFTLFSRAELKRLPDRPPMPFAGRPAMTAMG